MRITHLGIDATPKTGTMLAYERMVGVTNPLLARGVVLEGDFEPIVLISVDWLGIAGSGHRQIKQTLAQAAGTSVERVALHTVHQHDAPRVDPGTRARLKQLDLPCHYLGHEASANLAGELAEALALNRPHAVDVTHIGTGWAQVHQVASTRRVMGEDGKVAISRMSGTKDDNARAAPEGLIDPWLGLVSLWDGNEAVLGLSYYASHPQSYYHTARADCDFPGIARQQADTNAGVAHIYFTGAAGNVAPGKWNDRSRPARARLANNLVSAYRGAWDQTTCTPIRDHEVLWHHVKAHLPLADHAADRPALESICSDTSRQDNERITAARKLALNDDLEYAPYQTLSRLSLGPAHIVHGPAELFVEYQLYAQSLRPDEFVAMAAYGDTRYAYLGTATTREEGGYEAKDMVNFAADETEQILRNSLRDLMAK